MKVLVTGGAGFIGSHLCDRLLAAGWSVTCLDSFDDHYPREVKEANLAGARDHPDFRLVEGDIRDEELVDDLVGSLDGGPIAHLAARPGPRPSLRDPQLYLDVNVRGTLVLLDAARRHGARHRGSGRPGCPLLFASSSSVYGLNTRAPFSEEDPINAQASPYAATKAAAEHLCHAYAHAHGLTVTALRLFTVYGPRQRPDMAMARFARLIRAGEPLEVYGDGTSVRDYTYVDDVVRAMTRVLEDPPPGYDVFNIAGGEVVELNRVIALLERALGRPARRRQLPEQVGDVPATWADVEKARQVLDFAAEVGVDEGVARFTDGTREAGGE